MTEQKAINKKLTMWKKWRIIILVALFPVIYSIPFSVFWRQILWAYYIGYLASIVGGYLKTAFSKVFSITKSVENAKGNSIIRSIVFIFIVVVSVFIGWIFITLYMIVDLMISQGQGDVELWMIMISIFSFFSPTLWQFIRSGLSEKHINNS
ncbi:MAG: hypothetical protein WC693_03465 [Patescibacteria group bacterium]|jgi:hypothetical protein